MLKKLSFVLLALAALGLVACGDDTKAPKKDTGMKLPDGTITLPDGTPPVGDKGVTD